MDTDKATRAPAAGRYDLRSGIAASSLTGTCIAASQARVERSVMTGLAYKHLKRGETDAAVIS